MKFKIRPFLQLSMFILFGCFLIIQTSCKDKEGCTDPTATNYDAKAEKDDGSCTYAVDPIDSTGSVEVRFVPTMNGAPLSLFSPFTGPNNLKMTLETLRFYLSDIRLNQGSANILGKDVALLDFGTANTSVLLKVKEGDYTGLNFGIGVKKSLNGTGDENYNPAQWGQDHPLSIYNGMYWAWATGYIFLKVEGRIDTSATQNQTPNFSFFYHVGTDTTYTPKSFDDLPIHVVKGQKTTILLGFEVNDIFRNGNETIQMPNDYFTHTTDNIPLALKVIGNLKQAIHKL